MALVSLLTQPLHSLHAIASGAGGAAHPRMADFRVGHTSKAQVRSDFGAPSMEWTGENGTTTWEYPGAVVGHECFMLTFNADGVLTQADQVVHRDRLGGVLRGMSGMDVRRQLGRPANSEFSRSSQSTLWTWSAAGELKYAPRTQLEVCFDADGRVLNAREA